MVHAYILVQTEVGRAAAVAKEIGEIDGVLSAEDVTGPYDVIVRAKADDVDCLGQLTTIARELGCPISLDEVRPHAASALAEVFDLELEPQLTHA